MKYVKRIFALTLVMLPILAAAQLKKGDAIVAQVPFEFTAGNKVVPAGECIVQATAPGGRTLMIRNPVAGVAWFSSASLDETKEAAGDYALVFDKYGDHYFLAGIKLAAARTIYRLPESKAETELRAQNMLASEQIVLASLQ